MKTPATTTTRVGLVPFIQVSWSVVIVSNSPNTIVVMKTVEQIH